jgi:hypothetical protein
MLSFLSRCSVPYPVRRARGGLILVLILVISCQSKSPDEQLLKTVQPVGSWLASLEMTGRKWSANSVPASFVRNMTGAALEQIETAAGETGRSSARPGLREPLRSLLGEARNAAIALRRAANAGDRPAAAREVGRLAALHARFEALAKAGKGPA